MHETQKKIIIAAFVFVVLITVLFARPQITSAQILGTGTMPVWCVPWDFNCLKEGILDTAAKAIMKSMIRQLRAATINWILTGDFEIKKPFFVTSFIADPQRIADNAARTFLSGLTGINFCNFHPKIRSIQQFIIPLDFSAVLACQGPGQLQQQRPANGIAGRLASNLPSSNISSIVYNLKKEQEGAIQRGMSAFTEEVRNNLGFLGQRDPKTGKIKTPGNLIAETLIGSQNSEMFGQEVNQEIFSAIVDVIDTAIGKTIQDGILGKF